jgi:predicted NACHT family NTPase
LRDVDPEPEALRIDSAVVLKSIQAQHGLLVERARGIYSFSHLTFQEYFTAREIVATNQINFLVARINEKPWREVFLLTFGMIRSADELILIMKSEIDAILGKDEKTQQFLWWTNQKLLSVKPNCKSLAVRAFYYGLGFHHESPQRDTLATAINHLLASNKKYESISKTPDLDYSDEDDLDYSVYSDEDDLDCSDQDLDTVLISAFNLTHDRTLSRAFDLIDGLERAHNLVRNSFTFARALKLQREELKALLPNTSWENLANFRKWWQINGDRWTEDLRQIMIDHRNIGHDWQFTAAQKALLQQYSDANLLLVECLNSDCYVSRSVREEIEATLLLPMGEIEKLRMQN